MDRITKILRKLPAKLQKRVADAADAIAANRIGGLDIKPLKGRKGWYRCRIGDIRLIFVRTADGQNILNDVRYRDQAYRDL